MLVLAVAIVGVAVAASWAGGGAVQRLPDLDQLAPYDVSLRSEEGRTYVVFASAISNVGEGPLVIEGRRASLAAPMTVRQVIRLSDGSTREVRVRAELRYVRSPDHEHWHLLRFDRYELRRASDGSLVAPDRKTGFCLGDRKRLDPAPPRTPRVPAFRTRCGLGRTSLYTIREGISVGYVDDYKPQLEGQEFEVTGLPPGRYLLVHRANADRALRESDYGNNAASALLELGPDSVRVLRSCPETARCGS